MVHASLTLFIDFDPIELNRTLLRYQVALSLGVNPIYVHLSFTALLRRRHLVQAAHIVLVNITVSTPSPAVASQAVNNFIGNFTSMAQSFKTDLGVIDTVATVLPYITYSIPLSTELKSTSPATTATAALKRSSTPLITTPSSPYPPPPYPHDGSQDNAGMSTSDIAIVTVLVAAALLSICVVCLCSTGQCNVYPSHMDSGLHADEGEVVAGGIRPPAPPTTSRGGSVFQAVVHADLAVNRPSHHSSLPAREADSLKTD